VELHCRKKRKEGRKTGDRMKLKKENREQGIK